MRNKLPHRIILTLALLALASLSLMQSSRVVNTVSAQGKGGTIKPLPTSTPAPSAPKKSTAAKSSQPMKKSTTSSRGSRSSSKPSTDTSSAINETDDSSATLEETLNWIGARLADLDFYSYFTVGNHAFGPSINATVEEDLPGSPSYKIDGCTVTMERAYKTKYGNSGSTTLVIPLGDIDPSTIRRRFPLEVAMRALHSTPRIIETIFNVTDPDLSLTVKTEQDAKSFERAVKHAVRLCADKRKKDVF